MAIQTKSRRSRQRRHNHRRRLLYTLAAAGLLIAAIAASILISTLRPVTLRIAVGSDGDNARIVEAIARVLTRERSPVRLSVMPVGEGRTEDPLNSGSADLAVVRSDTMSADVFAVATLRKSALLMWTAHMPGQKGSRTKEWKDVAGSRIAMLKGGPADIALLKVVLASEGVSADKVDIVTLDSMDAMAAENGINVFAAIGVIKSAAIVEGLKSFTRLRESPSFLAVETADAIVLRQPRMESGELPKAAFGSGPAFPPEAIAVITVSDLIVGSKAISEQTGAAFARELFAHRQAILREVPAASIEKPDTAKDAPIPTHPGVAAFIDGTERTFLERYSDYLWGGVLLLSALGSFGAGLRALPGRPGRE